MIKYLNFLYYHFIAVLLNFNAKELEGLIAWAKRGYPLPAPQKIKIQTLKRWGSNEVWIETGTHLGHTTSMLSKFSSYVISLEPSEKFFGIASKSLSRFPNIELWHGSSENSLNLILRKLERSNKIADLNFWLDGHFSSGDTYKGRKDTPILEELEIISEYIPRIKLLTIFIDDVRLFRSDIKMPQVYPGLDDIIDWARKNKFYFTVENDIFIITNRTQFYIKN